MTKLGAGTLTFSGSSANTYTGDTQVKAGALTLAKGGQGAANDFGSAMGGDLVVNIGGTVRYGADSQVRDGKDIVVNTGGLLDLNGFAESITNLGIFGGSVTTGAGYVNVRGSLSADGSSNSTYAGNLHLEASTAGGQSQVSVGSGGTLTMLGVVSNGDNGLATQLVKTGAGTLNLTNVNTYTGGTNVTAGTLAIAGSIGTAGSPAAFFINGASANAATVALSGTGSLSTGGFFIRNGTVNQTGGSATTNGNQLYVGTNTGNTGVWNLSGANSTLSTGDVIVGNAGGAGIFNQTGGSVTLASGKLLLLGLDTGNNSTWSMSGGSLSANTVYVGLNGNGTFTQTGGSVTTNGNGLLLGTGTNSTGTYTISGANSTLSAGAIFLGNGGGAGTFNLNGGTVTAAFLGTPSDSTGTLNLNGGTLRPSASNTNFIQSTANVRDGGARIDTNGANITINEVLRHSTVSGDNPVDGGLTKLGTGRLTLTGANTYTGNTTVTNGTLALDNNNTTVARLANASGITVNNGGTLLLAQSGATTSTDRINNAATVTVNGGGTLNTGGWSEGMRPSSATAFDGAVGLGALTLTGTSGAHSVIDFLTGANGSSLVFNSLAAGSSGAFVDILNWSGTALADNGSAGNDRLLFASDPAALNLANFVFYNDNNSLISTGGAVISYGDQFEIVPGIVPVPEPTTWAAGLLAVLALGWHCQARRRQRG